MKKKYLTAMTMLFITVITACALAFSTCVVDLTEELDIKTCDADYMLPSVLAGTPAPYLFLKSIQDKTVYFDLLKTESLEYTPLDEWEFSIEPELNLRLNEYDDAFFAHSNLVMIHQMIGGVNKSKVQKIGVNNNVLYIKIQNTMHIGPQPTEIRIFFMLLPVKKSSFNGEKVDIEIRNVYTFW